MPSQNQHKIQANVESDSGSLLAMFAIVISSELDGVSLPASMKSVPFKLMNKDNFIDYVIIKIMP